MKITEGFTPSDGTIQLEDNERRFRFPKQFVEVEGNNNDLGSPFNTYCQYSMLLTAFKGGDELARSLTALDKDVRKPIIAFLNDLYTLGLFEDGVAWRYFSKIAHTKYDDVPPWRIEYFFFRAMTPYARKWATHPEQREAMIEEITSQK